MVTVNGRHVALFRLGDEFYAIDNLCLHQGGPLCERLHRRQRRGNVPVARLVVRNQDGTLVQDPRVGVSKHEVRIEDEVISVRLTD